MAVTIHIPGALRPYVGGSGAVDVEAPTVSQALAELTRTHERLRPHLFQEDGRLRSFVNVYVNERDIRDLAREATPLQPGDEVTIVPSIAGGATARPS
ncbi:MAG: MoaD/ThiS family protein [Gemmatimonadetes bacterium]|nr:MoaD/ThiS family protein [Gemmatimonadota bacterium]